MATPIEPPEDPPAPRRPWGARTNRSLIAVLGLVMLWLLVKTLGAGFIAVPLAVAAFVVAVLGLLAIETVVLAPLRRFPSVLREPVYAYVLVGVALVLTVVREVGAVSLTLQTSAFSTTYVTRSRIEGDIVKMPFRFDCEIRCEGGEVCDAMGDTIAAACESTAPDRLVIDISVDDPFCYTPLVKRFTTAFTATAQVPTARLQLEAQTRATVVGIVSCRTARRMAGAELARQLLAAIADMIDH